MIKLASIGLLDKIGILPKIHEVLRIPDIPSMPLHRIGQPLVNVLYELATSLMPPHERLLFEGTGFIRTAAIRAAAKLAVPDTIYRLGLKKLEEQNPERARELLASHDPDSIYHSLPGVTIQAIAEDVCASPPHLQRLLRTCTILGIFHEDENGLWYNTKVSNLLRQEHSGSFKAAAEMFGGEQYVALSALANSIRTGSPSFARIYGDFWKFHEESQKDWNAFADDPRYNGSAEYCRKTGPHTQVENLLHLKEFGLATGSASQLTGDAATQAPLTAKTLLDNANVNQADVKATGLLPYQAVPLQLLRKDGKGELSPDVPRSNNVAEPLFFASQEFNDGMTSIATSSSSYIASDGYFGDTNTLVDIAGGRGLLLTEVLRKHSGISTGILFDMEYVYKSPEAWASIVQSVHRVQRLRELRDACGWAGNIPAQRRALLAMPPGALRSGLRGSFVIPPPVEVSPFPKLSLSEAAKKLAQAGNLAAFWSEVHHFRGVRMPYRYNLWSQLGETVGHKTLATLQASKGSIRHTARKWLGKYISLGKGDAWTEQLEPLGPDAVSDEWNWVVDGRGSEYLQRISMKTQENVHSTRPLCPSIHVTTGSFFEPKSIPRGHYFSESALRAQLREKLFAANDNPDGPVKLRHHSTYMMMQILHDWSDKDSIEILKKLRIAMLQTPNIDPQILCCPEQGEDLGLYKEDFSGLHLSATGETRVADQGHKHEVGGSAPRCSHVIGFDRKTGKRKSVKCPSKIEIDFTSTLYVIDRIQDLGATLVNSKGVGLADLLMMNNFDNAKERYAEDMERVLREAGFTLKQIIPTRSQYGIVEAIPLPPDPQQGVEADEAYRITGPTWLYPSKFSSGSQSQHHQQQTQSRASDQYTQPQRQQKLEKEGDHSLAAHAAPRAEKPGADELQSWSAAVKQEESVARDKIDADRQRPQSGDGNVIEANRSSFSNSNDTDGKKTSTSDPDHAQKEKQLGQSRESRGKDQPTSGTSDDDVQKADETDVHEEPNKRPIPTQDHPQARGDPRTQRGQGMRTTQPQQRTGYVPPQVTAHASSAHLRGVQGQPHPRVYTQGAHGESVQYYDYPARAQYGGGNMHGAKVRQREYGYDYGEMNAENNRRSSHYGQRDYDYYDYGNNYDSSEPGHARERDVRIMSVPPVVMGMPPVVPIGPHLGNLPPVQPGVQMTPHMTGGMPVNAFATNTPEGTITMLNSDAAPRPSQSTPSRPMTTTSVPTNLAASNSRSAVVGSSSSAIPSTASRVPTANPASPTASPPTPATTATTSGAAMASSTGPTHSVMSIPGGGVHVVSAASGVPGTASVAGIISTSSSGHASSIGAPNEITVEVVSGHRTASGPNAMKPETVVTATPSAIVMQTQSITPSQSLAGAQDEPTTRVVEITQTAPPIPSMHQAMGHEVQVMAAAGIAPDIAALHAVAAQAANQLLAQGLAEMNALLAQAGLPN